MCFHDVMTPCMNSFTANPFEINKLTSLAMNGNPAPCLHVEVSLKHSTRLASLSSLESSIRDHLRFSELVVSENGSLEVDSFHEDPLLSLHVCAMTVFSEDLDSSSGRSVGGVRLNEASLRIYLFELDEHGSSYENLAEESDGSSPTPAAVHWMLPSLELHRQWENLIYEDNVKSKLLNFTHTALRFSDKKVDPNKISWNRVVLLHGPPGTGKTSLCRAVAHKLSIRLGSRYTHGQLVEINSHSLFSKWFSESGKLVHQMFEKIREMVEEKEALVCVLIDEVESLATSRTSSGSEPGDALRVVNAMLTALDSIKDYPNVIIFTTSNITGSIDNAFVDRADIKHYIGHPTKNAIYQILQSSIEELMKKGIIELQEKCLPLSTFKVYQNDSSRKLMSLAESAEGLSGRTLKKLPFLAAAHLFASGSGSNSLFKLVDFLDAMVIAVKEQHTERENLTKTS